MSSPIPSRPSPPWLARWLLLRLLHGDARDVIIGDLDEEFVTDIQPTRGRWRARLWYWHQAIASLRSRRASGGSAVQSSVRSPRVLLALARDLGYAWRGFRRSPGFTLTAVVTLSLGIGATTVIFALVHATLFRPLPYADPDRLAHLWQTRLESESGFSNTSYPNFADWATQSETFEHMAGYNGRSATVNGSDGPVRIDAVRITAGFFATLGVTPALGRTFGDGDTRPDAPAVVIIADGLWRDRFGRDPDIVGRSVIVNGQPHDIVGVLPPGFAFARERAAQLWRPLVLSENEAERRGFRWLHVIARLRSGVTFAESQSEMDVIARRLAGQYPEANRERGIRVMALHDQVVGNARPVMLALLAAVGLLLCITAANIANLLLARTAGRGRELAIRVAMGASAGQVRRLIVVESILLSVVSGAVGVILGAWILALFQTSLPTAVAIQLPYVGTLGLDGMVLGVAFAVTAVTGVICGLVPAVQAGGARVARALTEGRGTSAGRGGDRVRRGLVISQVAFAGALLVGTILMVQSVVRLLDVDPGFRTDRLLTLRISLPGSRYPDAQPVREFNRQLVERVAALPGVVGVSAIDRVPLSGNRASTGFVVAGRPAPAPGDRPQARLMVVSPSYFGVMGIARRAGRTFTPADQPSSPPVVIVNERLARLLFPGERALGERLTFEWIESPVEIVGVVGDVMLHTIDGEAEPTLYLTADQVPSWSTGLVVRAATDPLALVPLIREQVLALDVELPIFEVQTMEGMIDASPSVFLRRYPALLLAGFAGLAVLLVGVGLYGLINYTIKLRHHEIGVRLALGATPTGLVRSILRDGMGMVAIGLLVALAGSVALARLLEGTLFGVRPFDAPAYIIMVGVMVAIGLVGCAIPALRATRIDPADTLRE